MVGVCEYWDEAEKGVDRFNSFQLDSEFGLIPGYLPARRTRDLRPFDSDVITGSYSLCELFSVDLLLASVHARFRSHLVNMTSLSSVRPRPHQEGGETRAHVRSIATRDSLTANQRKALDGAVAIGGHVQQRGTQNHFEDLRTGQS